MNQRPLAETLRPKNLDEFCGQEHTVGKNGLLARLLEQKNPISLLFWGPPGSGKTTLAKIYSAAFQQDFKTFSATEGSISDFKNWIKEKQKSPLFSNRCVVFIDEIHRFNKNQQDVFLPLVEKGEIILIGATTENPSFALNHALISRLRVITLHSLDEGALLKLIKRFLSWSKRPDFSEEVYQTLIHLSQGDGRHLMNLLEHIDMLYPKDHHLVYEDLKGLTSESIPHYDRTGDQHYNLISALHKSVRGSDPDAAIYWLSRMLQGGEDPKYLLRRIIRMSMEDIGLADPNALSYTLSCADAFERLGSPEGEIAMAMAVVYLSLAPKSNSSYIALQKGLELAKKTSSLSPPKHILNAPTGFMKKEGYGKNYQYDHDFQHGFSGQSYFPEALEPNQLYIPINRGFEREMVKRLEFFKALREKPPKNKQKLSN